MVEIWKDILGYEGIYQVSNLGKVRSLDHYASNGYADILYKGRLLKSWYDGKKNYLMITLSKDGKHKHCLIHRLVAEAFIPNILNKSEVNHIDGIKTNNVVDNLEWTTSKENKEHAIKNGYYLNAYKNRKGKSKIYINGVSINELARQANMDYMSYYNRYVRGNFNG